MRPSESPLLLTIGRVARKLFLSAFVVMTFLVYAVHERLAGPAAAVANGQPSAPNATAPAPTAVRVASNPTAAPVSQNANSVTQPAAATAAVQPTPALPQPTAVPPTTVTTGQYKDGQYTGPRVDAFYGWVQVQAVVQNGQIADVKFLQYPNDRRTSQRINNIAMPYLTSEAIQAQSANVDIISGATLTSEAFAQSLQYALQNAAQ
jgi:uncharacterized protein with FMN-binding domain